MAIFIMMSLIEVRGLCYAIDNRSIFDHIDLDVKQGKITAIMGPSGTGKTTLLRMIGGQLRPDGGTITMDGQNISTLNRRALYTLRQRMGMLFQSGALFTDMTVFDNVALPIRVHTTLPETYVRDLVLMKLQAVGLRGARDLMPSQLSGGMARRAALARAVALEPEIVMYDEPFAGQDPIGMGVLLKLIKSLNETMGMTSVIVSHDVAETAQIADYIYLLADGKIVCHGTPDHLLQHKDPHVCQFMQGLADGPVAFDFPASDLRSDFGCA